MKIEDLKNYVPTLFMTETAIGNNISIRGIFSGVNPGFEQSVGTYVDGVYRGRPQQTRAPFLDLERVEVLRGPQSILFGKNSVGGALNITTARPTSEFEAMVSALYETDLDERSSRVMSPGRSPTASAAVWRPATAKSTDTSITRRCRPTTRAAKRRPCAPGSNSTSTTTATVSLKAEHRRIRRGQAGRSRS